MFAGGTVSPMMCPSGGQQKDDKKGQAGDKARRQRPGARAKRRPQQGGQFSLKLFLPGVLGPSGVISHAISREMVISYPI